MAVVNFTVPKNLERRVESVIQEKGFVSRAEFFRFAAIYFIDILEKHSGNEEERFEHLTKLLEKEVLESSRGQKLSSLKEQLADV